MKQPLPDMKHGMSKRRFKLPPKQKENDVATQFFRGLLEEKIALGVLGLPVTVGPVNGESAHGWLPCSTVCRH